MSSARPERRRPQWRGERRAVAERMPVEVADRPTAEAQRTDRSVIDRAAELIVDHLRITIAHTDRKSAQMQQRMTTAAEPLVLARPTAGVDTV